MQLTYVMPIRASRMPTSVHSEQGSIIGCIPVLFGFQIPWIAIFVEQAGSGHTCSEIKMHIFPYRGSYPGVFYTFMFYD